MLSTGTALVCGRHCPLPRSCGQPQGGQREQRPWGDPRVRGGQRAEGHWHLCVPPHWALCQARPHPQIHPDASPVRGPNVHGGQHPQRDAVH